MMVFNDLNDAEKLEVLKEHFEYAEPERVRAAEALLDDPDPITGTTFFHKAASRGCIACIAYLLEKYPRLYDQKSKTNLVALHYGDRRAEITNYLCDARFEGRHLAYIDQISSATATFQGFTPLESVIDGYYTMGPEATLAATEALLSNGARLFRHSISLWNRGVRYSDWEATLSTVALLVKHGVNPNPEGREVLPARVREAPEVAAVLAKYGLKLNEKGQPIVAASVERGSIASTLTFSSLAASAEGRSLSGGDSADEAVPQ
jgi:hypothetical protein